MKRSIVMLLILAAHPPAFASHCGRLLATSLVLVNFGAAAAPADGYGDVPTQAQRVDPATGNVPYPNFPHLTLVDETTGELDRANMALLTDPELFRRIEGGAFTALAVRNLGLEPERVTTPDGVPNIPISVSVRYRKAWSESVCPNGTIDVGGLIRVHSDGTDLHVKVERYKDSKPVEAGFRTIGCNRDVDLPFARAIVIPLLEHWFNEDQSRIRTLLDLAGQS